MTYVLFFVIGLSGSSAQFASKDLCEGAGKQLRETFNPPTPAGESISVIGGPRIIYFCYNSGFRVPQ